VLAAVFDEPVCRVCGEPMTPVPLVGWICRHCRGHQFALLCVGRFVPELNPIAAGMAGTTRMRPTRYSALAVMTAAW
jgi:hypothetical protein